MSLDGGLSALRAAIASGRPVELSGSGADASLTIDGVAYPAMGETTFAGGRLGATARRYYKLVALWMQHKCGASAGYSDYLAALREAGIANAITIAVMVTDRAAVMDYLEGRSTAHEHIASSPAATARAEGDKEGVRRAALRGPARGGRSLAAASAAAAAPASTKPPPPPPPRPSPPPPPCPHSLSPLPSSLTSR